MFRKVRRDLSGKMETSRPIMYSVQLCQFEPIQVTILFFQLSYPGEEITTNSHVFKVSIMYKYIYDFDPSFRGFNSPLD